MLSLPPLFRSSARATLRRWMCSSSSSADTSSSSNAYVVDSHSHILSADFEAYPAKEGPDNSGHWTCNRFTAEELMREGWEHNVAKFVAIQHAPIHAACTAAAIFPLLSPGFGMDHSYLFDTIQKYPIMFRAVLWIDEENLDINPDVIEALMLHSQPKGAAGYRIHPSPMFSSSTTWLETAGMQRMWEVAKHTKQALCCLLNPEDLPRVEEMSRKNPGTPVVVDHMARLGMAAAYGGSGSVGSEAGEEALLRLADLPDVTVKVSAFYAMGEGAAPHLELLPRIERLVSAFGADRLMWGSDCPYQIYTNPDTKERTVETGTYGSSVELIRDHLQLKPDDRDMILRGTAERIFFHDGV